MSGRRDVRARFGLEGRVALVTGAAGTLGSSYCRALAESGARVGALDLDAGRVWLALEGLDPDGVLPLAADVTDRPSLEAALSSVTERFGSLDVLVNNAAIDAPPDSGDVATGRFEDFPVDAWREIVDVNLTGVFLCCQVFGGHMAAHGGGSVVNIASIYGVVSPDQRIYRYRVEREGREFFKPAAYSAAKSGIGGLTRYLATYWADAGVRVNTLTLAGVGSGQDPAFLEGYLPKVPLGRMARSDEYDAAVVFLASDASSYMTGSDMVIDGGFTAW